MLRALPADPRPIHQNKVVRSRRHVPRNTCAPRASRPSRWCVPLYRTWGDKPRIFTALTSWVGRVWSSCHKGPGALPIRLDTGLPPPYHLITSVLLTCTTSTLLNKFSSFSALLRALPHHHVIFMDWGSHPIQWHQCCSWR